ncbi:MAG: beta-ketoacyl reductase, partial [Cyanobacteria bacterium J06659_2]
SGLSLNWGVWTEIGAAAQKQATTQMALKGIGAITPQAGAQTFAPLFSQRGMSQIGVVPLNWPQLLEQWPTTPFFADFISQRMPQQVPQAEFLQQLQALPKTAWRSRLTHYLRQEIATILGFSSVDDVDLRQGFFDLGMDSLTAVELKNRLQSSFGCSLSTTLIFDYPTGESVVDYLAQTVLGLNSSEVASLPSAIEPPAAPPAQDGLVDQVKTLSETEIADLLQQELVAIEQGRQG